MGKRVLIFCIACVSWCFNTFSQDFSLSNHNTVPFSINPSSVGAAGTIRLGLNYRMQWPTLVNAYHTVRLSYDQNVYKRMCSVGVAYSYDQHSVVFGSHEIDVVYAHTFKCADKHFIRLGLQGSFFYHQYDPTKLTFGDQFDPYTGNTLPTTVEGQLITQTNYFDFSVGASYVFENHLTVGFAVYHLAEPYNGFEENSQRLHRKYVAHANFIQDLKLNHGLMSYGFSDNYFFANASYQQQSDFKQFRIGAGICYQPVIVGISYKTDLQEVHTPSFTVGGYYKGFQLYYTFDVFASSKENGSFSHELSMVYTIPTKKKDLCPVVYW